jgi:hypothetical protein
MMRIKIAILLLTIFLLISGAALIVLGVFAYELGIDNNPDWGRSRVMITLAGALLLSGAGALRLRKHMRRGVSRLGRSAAYQRAKGLWKAAGERLRYNALILHAKRLFAYIAGVPLIRYFSGRPTRRDFFFAWSGVGLTLVVYLWYITSGTFSFSTPYSLYFDSLANAFLAGQVALLEEPSAQLLALENPYDWRSREGISQLWDATLYQGKYYFYWGPVPGLLAAAYKAIHPVTVDDQYLLLFFCGGLVIVFGLLLLFIKQTVFPHAPSWSLLPLTLLGGLSVPLLWLINRPSVYETAIAGGQFFLLLGLYAALQAIFGRGRVHAWLFVAGFAWGAAVNCRLNLAAAVGMFSAVTAWVLYRKSAGLRGLSTQLAWLALPLVLWAAGLGWYNAARFGSPFEMGHRYQLTGPALPPDYQHVISTRYIVPSLYSYLARPLEFDRLSFPFVFAPFIRESMWPFFIRLPEYYYYPEPVAGLFRAVPGFWLIFLPLLGVARRAWLWLNETKAEAHQTPSFFWLILYGGALSLFLPLLVFITTSMRYLADAAPFLALTSAVGLWWSLRFFKEHPLPRRAILVSAAVLIIASIAISLLLNLSIGDHRFEANNPELYHALANFFTPND